MKKLINKLSLFLILSTLVIPANCVFAENLDDLTNSNVSSSSITEEGDKTGDNENNGKNEIEDSSNNEAYLDNLEISGVEFNEKFDKDVFNYSASVKSTTKSVRLNIELGSKKMSITDDSDATCKLENDSTDCVIKVMSGNDKNTVKYTVTINKATTNLDLKSLSIKGIPLTEEFDKDVTSYTAEVSYNVPSIIVEAVPDDASCKVTVSNNPKNLPIGKTVIKVNVRNSARETKTYKITVNRLSEDETLGDDVTSGIVSSSDDDTSKVEVSDSIGAPIKNNNKDDGNNSNIYKTILVCIICALLVIVAGIGIYFYVVTGNSEKNRMRKIAKLKKKQAKIEEQLTGLMPVITEEQSRDYLRSEAKQNENNSFEEENTEIDNDSSNDDDFEDTIEIEVPEDVEEVKKDTDDKKVSPKNTKTEINVLDDFDDLFDDE